MAVSVTHATVAAGENAGNGEIAKEQWNEGHALTASINKVLGTDGASTTVIEIDCTAAGRALLDDADAAAQRTTLGLGSAATAATSDFATAAQGSTADSAVQPGDLATVATTGDYEDLTNKPTLGSAAAINATVSTSEPTGGNNGDIWFVVEA